MEHFFTFEAVARMSLELSLGICIKLFCDNGRIHYRDFMNDFLFWVPGLKVLPGDGLSRAIATANPAAQVVEEPLPAALAAK